MLYFSIDVAAIATLTVLFSGICGLFVQFNRTVSRAIMLSVLLLVVHCLI